MPFTIEMDGLTITMRCRDAKSRSSPDDSSGSSFQGDAIAQKIHCPGNRMLGLTGQPFWPDESYDRQVRNDAEFERICNYIETNPVKAGLAATPEEFQWPSAGPIDNRVANLPH